MSYVSEWIYKAPILALWVIELLNSPNIKNDSISLFIILQNQNSLHLFEEPKYFNKINWYYLCGNSSDDAVRIILKNKDKIRWLSFSLNNHPDAILLLEENPEKIDWMMFSRNTSEDAIKIWEKIY